MVLGALGLGEVSRSSVAGACLRFVDGGCWRAGTLARLQHGIDGEILLGGEVHLMKNGGRTTRGMDTVFKNVVYVDLE